MKTPSPPAIGVNEQLPGVPFYVKTAGCKHQTIWLQPVYTLTLSAKVTSKEPASEEGASSDEDSENPKSQGTSFAPSRAHSAGSASSSTQPQKPKSTSRTCSFTKVVSLSVYNGKEQAVQKLQSLLSQASATPSGDTATIKEIFEAWNAITPATYDPLSASDDDTVDSANVYVASNTTAPELYVDYNTTYYFNSKTPLAGSSQATAKLAEDGTLTEGTAQIESKTLQTFLALLPVSDVLKTVATGALPPAVKLVPEVLECASPTAKELTYDFDLKITTKALKRTHSAFVLADSTIAKPPCALPKTFVMKPNYAAYNASVEEVTAEGESKADSNTVKVSGTVTLPKSTDKATQKPK